MKSTVRLNKTGKHSRSAKLRLLGALALFVAGAEIMLCFTGPMLFL